VVIEGASVGDSRGLLDRLRAWRRNPDVDPPEAWESPAEGHALPDLSGRTATGRPAGLAYRPDDPGEIPPGAFDALADACGVRRADQVFVLPTTIRPTDDLGRRMVRSPRAVLGVGDGALGYWVEESRGGTVRAVVTTDELAVLEESRVLLYTRLRFSSATADLTVRLSTVAMPDLRPTLAALRRRVAGSPMPVPERRDDARIAPKWQNALRSPAVTLREGDACAAVVGTAPLGGRLAARGVALLALTPFELVVLTEPAPHRGNESAVYGVDAVQVPRRRLQGLDPQGGELWIVAAGRELRMVLDPQLVAEARIAFDGLLPWSATGIPETRGPAPGEPIGPADRTSGS
jgi:hypothetical protein